MTLYGYGAIGLALVGLLGVLAAILSGWRAGKAGERVGAAKQHAKEVRAGMDAAVDRQDDQAVQDALEAELLRSTQPKP